MSEPIEHFGFGPLTDRMDFFSAVLEVNGIRIQFSETDNTTTCKVLLDWLLQFDQIPNEENKVKNNRKSRQLRKEGNVLFGKKEQLTDALELYNKAICWAEAGEDLALGYANRSAVYFQWKLYDVCIENIDLAIATGCPELVVQKLETRKANCILRMQPKDIVVEEANVNGDRKPITAHFHCRAINDRRDFQEKTYAFDVHGKRTEPKLSLEENPKIPFIVNCLEMKSNVRRGRHIVSKSCLKPGQIISIERPYINSLTKYHRYRKCANCFDEKHLSLIPCPSCACTMFCSKECLAEAERGFHRYECPIADYIWTHCEEFALTVRMVVKVFSTFDSVQELIEFREKTNAKSNENPFSYDHKNDISEKVRYGWVNNLVTNEKRRIESDMFSRCCKVAILYHYLIEKTKFAEMLRTQRERDVLMSVILQHTQVSSVNCFNLYQYDDIDIDAFTELKPLDVFSRGIFPLSSLFNHSCAPNIATIAAGTKLVTYVTRPIKCNEELMVRYKRYDHFENDKITRVRDLSLMYGFDCKCIACEDDYPRWFDTDKIKQGIRTDEIKYLTEVYLSDLNMEQSEIAKFCSILDENADSYPCLSMFNIGLKLHRAFILTFGNMATELQVLLNENHSQTVAAMEALVRGRRS